MKTLPTVIKSKGFTYTQVWREGKIAIYLQTKHDREWFEVIKIRPRSAFVKAGVTFPAHEAYPSSVEWGNRGWTFCTLPEAKTKAFSLVP